jgi:hypothetical protein
MIYCPLPILLRNVFTKPCAMPQWAAENAYAPYSAMRQAAFAELIRQD